MSNFENLFVELSMSPFILVIKLNITKAVKAEKVEMNFEMANIVNTRIVGIIVLTTFL